MTAIKLTAIENLNLAKMETILEENESEIHQKNQFEAETVNIKMAASDSEEPKTGAVAKKKRNSHRNRTKKIKSPTFTQRSLILDAFDAQMSHYEHPGKFFVKNVKDEELLNKIQYQIQNLDLDGYKLARTLKPQIPYDNDHNDISKEAFEVDVGVKKGDLVLAVSRLRGNLPLLRGKVKSLKNLEIGLYLKVFYIQCGNERILLPPHC